MNNKVTYKCPFLYKELLNIKKQKRGVSVKNKLIKFLELLLIVIIVSVCIFSIFDSSILDNRIYFIILLIVPFLLLFIINSKRSKSKIY